MAFRWFHALGQLGYEYGMRVDEELVAAARARRGDTTVLDAARIGKFPRLCGFGPAGARALARFTLIGLWGGVDAATRAVAAPKGAEETAASAWPVSPTPGSRQATANPDVDPSNGQCQVVSVTITGEASCFPIGLHPHRDIYRIRGQQSNLLCTKRGQSCFGCCDWICCSSFRVNISN